MTHTRTPWYMQRGERGSVRIATTSESNRETQYIAVLLDNGDAEQIPNAAFICRACNSHDKLVAALENISSQLGKAFVESLQGDDTYFHELARNNEIVFTEDGSPRAKIKALDKARRD